MRNPIPLHVLVAFLSICALSIIAAGCSSSKADDATEPAEGPEPPTEAAPEIEEEPGEAESPRAGGEPELSETPPIFWLRSEEEIPGLEQRYVGEGAGAAAILWPEGDEPSDRITVFLHRFSPRPPASESVEIEALIERGDTVIYPIYQDDDSTVEEYLDNAVAAVGLALQALDHDPRSLVFAGKTTGGALAFDLAAVAAEHGLPTPRAAIAIAPGREPAGRMPRPDYSRIDPRTHLIAAGDRASRIPENRSEARRMLRLATEVPGHRRHNLEMLTSRELPHHTVDQRKVASWRPILDLIDRARAGRR